MALAPRLRRRHNLCWPRQAPTRDLERIQREKQLFELGSEVTLCCKPGCMRMAEPIPGFREILCKECEKADT